MTVPFPGELAALATAFCWTISVLCIGAASKQIGSLPVNLLRLIVAWCILAVYGLVFRGQVVPADAPGSTWFWLVLSGFVGFVLGDMCLFKAIVLIGPRLSTLILSLAPPVTAVLGIVILGEKLTALNWLGIVVTLFGVSWVVLERTTDANGKRHPHPLRGTLLALFGAVGQAFGLVFGKLGMGEYSAFASTHIRVTAGVAGFAAIIFFLGRYRHVLAALRRPRALVLTGLGSVLGTFLGVSLWLLSAQYIPTGVTQTIASIIPVLIIPFVIIIYKERPSPRAIAGACIAVGGVVLLFLPA